MHENFVALEQEKRDRIINAAMREFSAKGFKNASTNEIVKNAGISKGALFHYFSSKKELFEFLFHYSIDFFVEALYSHTDNMPADVFERWMAIGAIKIKIAAQHPDMADFVQYAAREDAKGFQEFLISEKYTRFVNDLRKKVYDGIDLSKFKPNIDTQKALQIIWWVLEEYALAKQKEPFDPAIIHDSAFADTVMQEVGDYLGMLKKAFYKEAYI